MSNRAMVKRPVYFGIVAIPIEGTMTTGALTNHYLQAPPRKCRLWPWLALVSSTRRRVRPFGAAGIGGNFWVVVVRIYIGALGL